MVFAIALPQMEISLAFQREAAEQPVAQQVIAGNETRKITFEIPQPLERPQTIEVLPFQKEPTAKQSVQVAGSK